MTGAAIIGTGRYLPGKPVTNADLARVMETSDEWIRQRTGIAQRHFCPEGLGASDLAAEAAKVALDGIDPGTIDYVIFATMTPDYVFPGPGAMVAAKLGLGHVPALDVRQQCAAFPYGFQLAESLLVSGAARRVLFVAAEAHAPFMPWTDWHRLEGSSDAPRDEASWERATRHRGFSVIFGDGAGALVLERSDEAGLLAVDLHSDGTHYDQIYIEGGGFKERPYVSPDMIAADRHVPQMKGRELFKLAVTRLPRSIRSVCEKAGVTLDDVDWFLAHQANDRINGAVRDALKLPAEKVPSNIARYGNTSGATIPILLDELRKGGKVKPGQLICFFALGAGLHWGAALYRA